jgi:hypothetical protein
LIFQAFGNTSFQQVQHLLDIRELGGGIVVVIHRPALVFGFRRDIVNDESRFLAGGQLPTRHAPALCNVVFLGPSGAETSAGGSACLPIPWTPKVPSILLLRRPFVKLRSVSRHLRWCTGSW